MSDVTWRLPADAKDWECDWESAKRFQLRYFRSLPMAEKIRAIEELKRIARALQRPGRGAPPR
jgi:hypothetical protein